MEEGEGFDLMAPPEHTFPVSELEDRVHYVTKNLKEKSRKLPKDFDLKRDCELLELVQYSCTTPEQQYEQLKKDPTARTECFPFVRLFRRCGQGENMFHVETTAWEGEHAWVPKKKVEEVVEGSSFANYGSYFWNQK